MWSPVRPGPQGPKPFFLQVFYKNLSTLFQISPGFLNPATNRHKQALLYYPGMTAGMAALAAGLQEAGFFWGSLKARKQVFILCMGIKARKKSSFFGVAK